MRARDDLAIALLELGDECGMLGRGHRMVARENAEIVDPLEHDQIAHAGLREHVAVEPGERVGAEPVAQHAIAADPVVDERQPRSGGEPGREHVGPAIVAVGGGAVPVGDRIAECDDRPAAAGDIDTRCEIPMLDAVADERGVAAMVARGDVAART